MFLPDITSTLPCDQHYSSSRNLDSAVPLHDLNCLNLPSCYFLLRQPYFLIKCMPTFLILTLSPFSTPLTCPDLCLSTITSILSVDLYFLSLMLPPHPFSQYLKLVHPSYVNIALLYELYLPIQPKFSLLRFLRTSNCFNF